MRTISCLLLFCRTAASVDTWCGKAYRAGDAAFDPGGRLEPPERSPSPVLDLQIRPRVQPYLEQDVTGAFIIDTPLSYLHGQTNRSILVDQDLNLNLQFIISGELLSYDIYRTDTGNHLFGPAMIVTNSTGTVVDFSLTDFTPRLSPYNISLVASGAGQLYTVFTELLRLHNPDSGSVTKIDNLSGALLVSDTLNSWKPFFPYSYYLAGTWLAENPDNMATFKAYGYNVLHIVPGGGLGYNFTQLDEWLDEAQRVDLWIMYDMRWTYQDTALVEMQVNRLKARQNLLLWYTADEPDGHGDPLGATQDSYNLIKSLDPYHPVSLCLNCENYYFAEYAGGADIILSDVYPVGTNTSWSTQYDTVCNSTYGCCGCDNCIGYNDLSNVPERLDTLHRFQTQLGLQKPLWIVPQAFGNGEFWKRIPTQQEEAVMTMLSINHGAKGVIMWIFPTTTELTSVTSTLGELLTHQVDLILGGQRSSLITDGASVDVSIWINENQMLVSIVNPSYQDAFGHIRLDLPTGFTARTLMPPLWGGGWEAGTDSAGSITHLRRDGLTALSVDILLLR